MKKKILNKLLINLKRKVFKIYFKLINKPKIVVVSSKSILFFALF